MVKITVLTNAIAADQRSMIGYGKLVLEEARKFTPDAIELRGVSFLSTAKRKDKLGKAARNFDRFIASPISMIGHRTDLVHVVDPGNSVYLPFIARRAAVCTVHDMIPYLARDGHLDGFRPTTLGRKLMERILDQLTRFDRIVCVSEATRTDLLSLIPVDPDRVSVIRNAMFQELRPASKAACEAFRIRYSIPKDAPLVLHIGRNFYKNRSRVLEAFGGIVRGLPEARLVLVGALEVPLQRLAFDLGIDQFIHEIDYVASKEMSALYTSASVLLFPSLYEGFGYPVIEAEACGTPVVCSNRGSLPEIAGKDAAIVGAEDVDAMACACIEKINLGPRFPPAVSRFSVSCWSAQISALYQSI